LKYLPLCFPPTFFRFVFPPNLAGGKPTFSLTDLPSLSPSLSSSKREREREGGGLVRQECWVNIGKKTNAGGGGKDKGAIVALIKNKRLVNNES
jgi:hypothetical protein